MSERPVVLDVGVPSEDLSYPVMIGAGVLDRVGPHVRRAVPRAKRIALISDKNVMPLYGEGVAKALRAQGLVVVPMTITPGEASKTPEQMLRLTGELLRAGISRSDAVVAVGGGVVGDLAGLVAALFMRGIGFVQCPTSLLAQVDASVGGKVALDLPQGKNLIGAFHFPRAVLIDPNVLETLPDNELAGGLAEMLKHGALFDPEHFHNLQDSCDAIYARDTSVLGPLVATSVALKAACVIRDPLEKSDAGKGRVLLNLGHTIGHAIEHVSRFTLGHGQAVGLGLLAAARLSSCRQLCATDLEPVIRQALNKLGLPTDLDAWLQGDRLVEVRKAMAVDKKRSKNTMTYIALAGLGEPRVLTLAPDTILEQVCATRHT